MKKIVWLIVAILVIGGIYAALSPKSKIDKPVKVGYLSVLVGASHFVALDQGLYEKAGITVEATQFQSSNQLYDALAHGDIDATPDFSIVPVLINQIKDPGKVKVFSTSKTDSSHPFDRVVVKKGSAITSLSQLSGKKIAVFPGTTATAFLKDYMTKHGVDISKTQFVQAPPPNQIPALESGSVDALYAYEPNLTFVLASGGRAITEPIFSSYFEQIPVGAGALSSKFVAENPDAAKRLVDAFDAAYRFLDKNDADSRRIIGTAMKLSPEVANKVSLVYHTQSTDNYKPSVEKFINILISFKELPSNPDLTTLFYR